MTRNTYVHILKDFLVLSVANKKKHTTDILNLATLLIQRWRPKFSLLLQHARGNDSILCHFSICYYMCRTGIMFILDRRTKYNVNKLKLKKYLMFFIPILILIFYTYLVHLFSKYNFVIINIFFMKFFSAPYDA